MDSSIVGKNPMALGEEPNVPSHRLSGSTVSAKCQTTATHYRVQSEETKSSQGSPDREDDERGYFQ